MSAAAIAWSLLKAHAPLVSQVPMASLALDQLAADAALPVILVEDLSSAPLPLVAATAWPRRSQVSVTVACSQSTQALRGIVESVIEALHAQRGPVGTAQLWSAVLDEIQAPETDRDAGLIKQVLTFTLIYEE